MRSPRPERIEALPDLPTTAEGGPADVEVSVWHGLYVPAETPDEVVQALSDALKAALADQNVIDELAKLGAAPVPEDQATPEAHHGEAGVRRSSSGGRSSRRPA